jgi:hypothetical protein
MTKETHEERLAFRHWCFGIDWSFVLRNSSFSVLTAAFLFVFGAGCADVGRAYHPYPGLSYYIETRHQPPMRMFIAKVDLTNPRVHVRVAPGGPILHGSGPWETTLLQPTKIAARDGFDLVVNGDFFAPRRDPKLPNSKLTPGMQAMVAGPAMTDGNAWAAATNARPCLVIHRNKRAAIEMLSRATPDDWEVIAGNIMLVKDGVIVPKPSKVINPRTAVGLNAKGTKLLILVIDGRQPGLSVGTSDADTAAEMLHLGCRQAVNLDGGGSTVMAVRDPASGQIRIINIPSDGHERPVANILGISVDTSSHQ